MEFKAEYRSYITRYFGGVAFVLIATFGFFLGSLIYEVSISSLMGSLHLFFVIIGSLQQIIGYLSTNKHTKLLKLDDSYLVINFFKKPTITLKYSEIQSLEYTKDIFKNFEFTLSNGEKIMIYSTLKDNDLALKEIQKRIS